MKILQTTDKIRTERQPSVTQMASVWKLGLLLAILIFWWAYGKIFHFFSFSTQYLNEKLIKMTYQKACKLSYKALFFVLKDEALAYVLVLIVPILWEFAKG